jgi:hypothetical protein
VRAALTEALSDTPDAGYESKLIRQILGADCRGERGIDSKNLLIMTVFPFESLYKSNRLSTRKDKRGR